MLVEQAVPSRGVLRAWGTVHVLRGLRPVLRRLRDVHLEQPVCRRSGLHRWSLRSLHIGGSVRTDRTVRRYPHDFTMYVLIQQRLRNRRSVCLWSVRACLYLDQWMFNRSGVRGWRLRLLHVERSMRPSGRFRCRSSWRRAMRKPLLLLLHSSELPARARLSATGPVLWSVPGQLRLRDGASVRRWRVRRLLDVRRLQPGSTWGLPITYGVRLHRWSLFRVHGQ